MPPSSIRIRRGQLNADSISAALTAYQIAPSREERAEALGLLAQGYERTEDYRKTLEAYKAALAQAPLAYLEAAYDKALAKYGFRVVDYTVDADTSSPRICLQFSDAIGQTAASYDSFVLLDDKPAESVSVSEKQLCVDGAKHGVRYAVTVQVRPAVDLFGNPRKAGHDLGLCARPAAKRALHGPQFRAAAHRPPGHPGRFRQCRGGRARSLSHRCAGTRSDRARARFPLAIVRL